MRIIVVDDHALFLQGLLGLLEQYFPGVHVETYEGTGEAFEAIKANPDADLVLSDIYMPGHKGHSLLELLVREKILVPVLLISATEDIQLIRHQLDLGACGFVHKSSQPAELRLAVDSVLEQGDYLNAELSRRLSKLSHVKNILLSARQREVLALLSSGLSNKKIGIELGISEMTVKSHVSALFDYFAAENRLDCVRKAEKLGVIGNLNNHG